MSIPFIDLKTQYGRVEDEVQNGIKAVLEHGKYIMGPEVAEVEAKLAAYVGAKHAVGCASGTDALLMALLALGIGPGDAVFTSPFTFFATGESIALLGATPVYVDVDPQTYNIDPEKLALAIAAVRQNDPSIYPIPKVAGLTPKCVMPVDIFGLCADYDAIAAVAEEEGLTVIEDGAQAFGAEYRGRKACSFGDIACTSFFPAKPLGCYGDGGMCFTDSDDLAEKLRSVRVHGQGRDKYDNVRLGINGRLDSMQAAVLLAKFAIFPEEVERRQKVAAGYREVLANSGLGLPFIPEDCVSAWAQFCVTTKDEAAKEAVLAKLGAAGIPTAQYYPIPLHVQTAMGYLGYKKGDMPVTDDLSGRIFAMPMHPYLERDAQEAVAEALRG